MHAPDYDDDHFILTSERVKELDKLHDIDQFLEHDFTCEEIRKAISKLHMKKASGFDGVSSEHIKFAGDPLVNILTVLYNIIISLEYIPINFRRGI